MQAFLITSSILMGIVYFLECLFAIQLNEKARKIVKVFCIPTLALFIASLGKNNVYVYIALGAGWLGDIFLIFKNNKQLFGLGIVSFFLGHIFYLIIIISLLSYKIQIWQFVCLGVFGLLTPAFTYKTLYPKVGNLVIAGTYYFYMLLMMLLFTTLLLMDGPSLVKVFIFIGVLIFITSDSSILITSFFIDMKQKEILIMSTYLIAQTLISVGLSYLIV